MTTRRVASIGAGSSARVRASACLPALPGAFSPRAGAMRLRRRPPPPLQGETPPATTAAEPAATSLRRSRPPPRKAAPRFRIRSDILTLDPAFAPGSSEEETASGIYEGLLAYKPGTWELANQLAETFERLPTGCSSRSS